MCKNKNAENEKRGKKRELSAHIPFEGERESAVRQDEPIYHP
jgi:hypothetical protein